MEWTSPRSSRLKRSDWGVGETGNSTHDRQFLFLK
jgi:hypothetical protein